MARTILPSGEELNTTPAEILKYINPDGLRQVLRQERLHWQLKVNKDVDYTDNARLFKYGAEIHNEGQYQRMEIQTYSDNGAYKGYAGINNDSGVFGLVHNITNWDQSMSDESKKAIVNRTLIGATAEIPSKSGFGLNELGKMDSDTNQRASMILFDPFDGRAYLYTNDDTAYMNNEARNPEDRIPSRAIARIGDIPTRTTHLINDLNYITDPAYIHTDNNFTHSNRYILDNIDDRTFVYPEIAKDSKGEYIDNRIVGLNGKYHYGESDGLKAHDSEETGSPHINDYNANSDFSGLNHIDGYIPGVFRSLEELEKVDLIHQRQLPRTHMDSPGAKRANNWYINDGTWSSNWFDKVSHPDSYLVQSLNPNNMEIHMPDTEPVPYSSLVRGEGEFDNTQLYQWRYNRIDVTYNAEDIRVRLINPGEGYQVNDTLVWTFGDAVFEYKVSKVGAEGEIISGKLIPRDSHYTQNPSTHGVGVPFMNESGVGHGCLIAIDAPSTIRVHASQIKNNLYAYVDVVPTVASDNESPWSDIHVMDPQGGKVGIRSTAGAPGYTGINSGRGCEPPDDIQSESTLAEHGGNPTAGMHVHLFRYVINTEIPTWEIDGDQQVFTGKWVDQGPLGVERPSDIKALLFSNHDTNNYNNYAKFMQDIMIDDAHRNPDGIVTGNTNALSSVYLHIDQVDPDPERKFTLQDVDPVTSEIIERDVTRQVLYVNAATGIMFIYNTGYKSDITFGYGTRSPGWTPIAGSVSR